MDSSSGPDPRSRLCGNRRARLLPAGQSRLSSQAWARELAATPARLGLALRGRHDPHRRRRDAARVVDPGQERARRGPAVSWQRGQHLASARLRQDVRSPRLQHAARRLSRIRTEHRLALGAGHVSRRGGELAVAHGNEGHCRQATSCSSESRSAARSRRGSPSRERPRALVLASTFTSVPDLAAEIYPFLPVRLLSRFEYNTLDALARSRGAGARRAQPVRRHHPVSHMASASLPRRASRRRFSSSARRPQRRVRLHASGVGECTWGFPRIRPRAVVRSPRRRRKAPSRGSVQQSFHVIRDRERRREARRFDAVEIHETVDAVIARSLNHEIGRRRSGTVDLRPDAGVARLQRAVLQARIVAADRGVESLLRGIRRTRSRCDRST